jgi:hypothetical protein
MKNSTCVYVDCWNVLESDSFVEESGEVETFFWRRDLISDTFYVKAVVFECRYSKHLLRNEPFRVTKLSSGDTNEVHFDIKTRRQLARLWQLTGRAGNLIKRQIKFNGIRGKSV